VKSLSEILNLSRTNRPDEWSMDDFSRMASVLEKRIAGLEENKLSIILNAENQLALESKKYINISNRWLSGELKEIPEGSIYNENIYVETRIKDIKDPLFVDIKTVLESHNLEQQVKSLSEFAESLLFRGCLENTFERHDVLERIKKIKEGQTK
jgi:hypothetical protein